MHERIIHLDSTARKDTSVPRTLADDSTALRSRRSCPLQCRGDEVRFGSGVRLVVIVEAFGCSMFETRLFASRLRIREEVIPENKPVIPDVPLHHRDVKVVGARSTAGFGELDEEHPLGVRILYSVRLTDLFERPDATTPTVATSGSAAAHPQQSAARACSPVQWRNR